PLVASRRSSDSRPAPGRCVTPILAPGPRSVTPQHLTGRFRCANALNVGFGLRFNLVVLAPNAKFLICEPSHRVFFPLFVPEKRVGTLRHITTVGVKASIPEIEERDKFPPHIFSFLSNITSPRSTDGIKGG